MWYASEKQGNAEIIQNNMYINETTDPCRLGVSGLMIHPVNTNSPNAQTALYSHNSQTDQTALVSDCQILRFSGFSDSIYRGQSARSISL